MCDFGVSAATAAAIAGAAASAIGTGVTVMNNNAMADAQNRANEQASQQAALLRQREMRAQDAMGEERMAAWQQQLQQRSPDTFQQVADDQAGQIVDSASGMAASYNAMLPGQDRSSTEVQQEIARNLAKASRDSQTRIAALARMTGENGAFGLGESQAGIYNADANLAASKARRSLSLYGAESAAVQPTVKAGGMAGLGSALTGLGNLGLTYAGSQGTFGGGRTSSTSSSSTTGAGRA